MEPREVTVLHILIIITVFVAMSGLAYKLREAFLNTKNNVVKVEKNGGESRKGEKGQDTSERERKKKSPVCIIIKCYTNTTNENACQLRTICGGN